MNCVVFAWGSSCLSKMFAGNFAPRNWAFCDGQLLQIAQNTALFSLVGTIYGGDGRTTFGLPNLQGRAVMHPGNGPGLTTRTLGQSGGSTTTTLSDAQIPSHTHTLKGVDADAQSSNPAGKRLATSNEDTYDDAGSPNVFMASKATGGGSGVPHNNLQPYLAIYFIIALVGLYPSRS